MTRLLPRLLLAVLVMTALAASPAAAATITVTNANDSGPGSLRAAVAGAAGGDTVSVPAFRITLTSGAIDVAQPITIAGAGDGTVIDGSGQPGDGVFTDTNSTAGTPVSFQDLEITGGSLSSPVGVYGAGGAAIADSGVQPLVLTRVTITHNSVSAGAGANGAGGAVRSDGPLTLIGCTVSDNTLVLTGSGQGAAGGAGVYSTSTQASVTDSTFSGNALSGSVPSTNTGGGALFALGGVTVSGGSFTDNSAQLSLATSAQQSGGGALLAGGESVITGTRFARNSASVTASVTSVTGDDLGGGALLNLGGTLTVDRAAFEANTATISAPGSTAAGGGALSISYSAGVALTNSTFTGNTATVQGPTTTSGGGGLLVDSSRLRATNTTISGNDAQVPADAGSGGGGGIYFTGGVGYSFDPALGQSSPDPIGVLTNVTVADNGSSGSGGGVAGDGAPVRFKSSLVAANGSPNCTLVGGGGESAGYNLEDTSPSTCGFSTASHDLVGVAPDLGPLADNGGGLQTRALLAGSPAIDAVPTSACTDQATAPQPVSTDERGVSRPQGPACDIGAYEARLPSAMTGAASNVTATSATLNGTVNPNGEATSYHFEYGTSTAYGSSTPSASAGSGSTVQPVSAAVSGLAPATTYHVRVVAADLSGTTYGSDRTFTTPAAPSPTPSVSITAPKDGAVYALGQMVDAVYRCHDGAGGPGLKSSGGCVGTVPNGAPINTSTAGTHTFSATATSADGQSTTATVHYTVSGAPPSRGRAQLRLTRVTARAIRKGCVTELDQAIGASLSDRQCVRARVTMTGRIDRQARGQRLTIVLRARVGGRQVVIHAGARVRNGRFQFVFGLPGRNTDYRADRRKDHAGDGWRYTITYPGSDRLRPATLTGRFTLEVEH